MDVELRQIHLGTFYFILLILHKCELCLRIYSFMNIKKGILSVSLFDKILTL